MNAKEYLESQGVFGLDTKKRYNEVIEWMEGYAQERVKNCSIPAVIKSVCDCGKPIDSRYAPCCSMKCGSDKFEEQTVLQLIYFNQSCGGIGRARYSVGDTTYRCLLGQSVTGSNPVMTTNKLFTNK